MAPRWRQEWPEREDHAAHPGTGSRRRVRRRLRLRPEARFLFTVAALFALAVWVISRYAALYGMNQEILERQRRLAELQAANEKLEIQVAAMDSLARVERAARGRGYVEPEAVRTVRVPGEPGPLGDPGQDTGGEDGAGAPSRNSTVIALAPAGAAGSSWEPVATAAGDGTGRAEGWRAAARSLWRWLASALGREAGGEQALAVSGRP